MDNTVHRNGYIKYDFIITRFLSFCKGKCRSFCKDVLPRKIRTCLTKKMQARYVSSRKWGLFSDPLEPVPHLFAYIFSVHFAGFCVKNPFQEKACLRISPSIQ